MARSIVICTVGYIADLQHCKMLCCKLFVLKPRPYYVFCRCDVVARRAQHDLQKAQSRAHIVQGLTVAKSNLQEVIKKITGADSTDSASKDLRSSYDLSEKQVSESIGAIHCSTRSLSSYAHLLLRFMLMLTYL